MILCVCMLSAGKEIMFVQCECVCVCICSCMSVCACSYQWPLRRACVFIFVCSLGVGDSLCLYAKC